MALLRWFSWLVEVGRRSPAPDVKTKGRGEATAIITRNCRVGTATGLAFLWDGNCSLPQCATNHCLLFIN